MKIILAILSGIFMGSAPSLAFTLRAAQLVDLRDALLLADLKDGRLPAAVAGMTSLLEHHRGGRLRLLMTTAPKRLPNLPDVPTAREIGYPGLEDLEWFAFYASSKTAPDIVNEWNRQIVATMADPSLGIELAEFGMTTETSTPEEARARMDGHLTM